MLRPIASESIFNVFCTKYQVSFDRRKRRIPNRGIMTDIAAIMAGAYRM